MNRQSCRRAASPDAAVGNHRRRILSQSTHPPVGAAISRPNAGRSKRADGIRPYASVGGRLEPSTSYTVSISRHGGVRSRRPTASSSSYPNALFLRVRHSPSVAFGDSSLPEGAEGLMQFFSAQQQLEARIPGRLGALCRQGTVLCLTADTEPSPVCWLSRSLRTKALFC